MENGLLKQAVFLYAVKITVCGGPPVAPMPDPLT